MAFNLKNLGGFDNQLKTNGRGIQVYITNPHLKGLGTVTDLLQRQILSTTIKFAVFLFQPSSYFLLLASTASFLDLIKGFHPLLILSMFST